LGTEEFLQKTDEELELVNGGFGNGKWLSQYLLGALECITDPGCQITCHNLVEVTPYAPLLVRNRRVEVIFAIDGVKPESSLLCIVLLQWVG
jgi:hypothetical protein